MLSPLLLPMYAILIPLVLPLCHASNCTAGCACSSHQVCAYGYFCGQEDFNSGPMECRSCSQCYDDVAVDGKCPVVSNCESTAECVSDSQCSSEKFCSAAYTCTSCYPSCYTTPTVRKNRRPSAHRYYAHHRALDGWCPRSCCGTVTSFRSTYGPSVPDYTNTFYSSPGMELVFLLCDAERFDPEKFVAVALVSTPPENITIANVSSAQAVTCTISVDTSPNAQTYPRYVPSVQCPYESGPCERKRLGVVLFGTLAASGEQVRVGEAKVKRLSYGDCDEEDRGISYPVIVFFALLGALLMAALLLMLVVSVVHWCRNRYCPHPVPQLAASCPADQP